MRQESVRLAHQIHSSGNYWTPLRCTQRRRRPASEYATADNS
jgi:hypothetical protein